MTIHDGGPALMSAFPNCLGGNSDDSIYRISIISNSISTCRIESSKYRIFRYIAIFKNYRDISEISTSLVQRRNRRIVDVYVLRFVIVRLVLC